MFNNKIFYELGANSSYEPEYIAILQYATSNGYTTPKRNQNFLNNRKIKQLKSEGIFTELDILYNFKQQSGLEDFCKINWVNPGVYNATQSTLLMPTFEPDKGFKGTNSTYFFTNYIPSVNASNALLNDMAVIFKTYDEISGVVAGTRNDPVNNFVFRKLGFGNAALLCVSTGAGGLLVFTDNSHILHVKNGLTHSYYVNGSLNTSATYSSTTLSSVQLTLFAWNLNGAPSQFFTGGIEYFALGSSYLGTKADVLKTIFDDQLVSNQLLLNATYTLDNSIIANPERGFYEYTSTGENGGYNLLSESTLTDYRTIENITVIQRQFFLKDFITGIAISSTYLTNMQTDFNRIRNAGLKVIARFTYSSPSVAGLYQPTKAQILAHIDQLKPVVNANKDVIVSIQAGFIGRYGEWYYTGGTEGSDTDGSPEFGDKSNINATQSNNRKEVVDYMLSEFDTSIPLQVRTVPIKQTFYPSGNSRIGIYNDSFLNIWGDSGTFTADSAGATPSLAENSIFQIASLTAPISGETNGTNSVTLSRTDGPNAKIELDFYNWSLINRDYFPEIIASWTASGDFDIIAKDLGYRFQLNSSTFTKTDTNMNVVINLTNIGYANSFKSRSAYILFKNNSTSATYSYPITTDVNTWYSNVILNQTFDISSLTTGTYSSYIWLPDNDPTLSTRPEYSIRFSNTGTWDSITGYNNLNQTFSK
jgi:hypothetical protein